MKYNIIKLQGWPDMKKRAAEWFHEVTSVMDGFLHGAGRRRNEK